MITSYIRQLITATIVAGGLLTGIAHSALAQSTNGLLYEQGFLDQNGYGEHEFYGYSGQEIEISLNSPDFDTVLCLYGANGRQIACNDDVEEGSLNSGMQLTLDRDGTYRILVQGFDGGQRGRYTLFVNDYSVEPPFNGQTGFNPRPVVSSQPTELVYDQGFLNAGGFVEHEFYAYSGQDIQISLSSPDFDTVLCVYSSNGRQIACNDDVEGSLDSGMYLTIDREDTYRILVQGYNNSERGRYTLAVVQP